jgi:acetylornithine deacetylase/succinyl-diaminopimelate desuccinylase-like protein
MQRFVRAYFFSGVWAAVVLAVCAGVARGAEDAAAAEAARLREAVTWLAAPEREGRGPGTPGIDAAADWVAKQLADAGLDTRVVGAGPFQPFVMTLDATLGPAEKNRAEIVGPPGGDGRPQAVPLELGKDFAPLAAGGTGDFDLPLVFAGFGITAPAEHYDDYAPLADAAHGSAAKGAAVIVLRQEPQKDDPHSIFDGNQASQHAALSRKVANASEHEAGGLVFCNEGGSDDELMAFTRAGDGSTKRALPILHVRRAVVDRVVQQALGKDLATIEKEIDESLTPRSSPLAGWRIRGTAAIERTETTGRNVLALLPGTGAPATADHPAIDPRETVVLGAHYDHLGYGGSNSAAPGEHAIHHGADDNASGTAMLVEVARRLKATGPFPRSILFVAFSGEERGLLGSGHYTANAAIPLADTVAMVNLDMVGRLADNKIVIHGTGTGTGLDALVDRLVADHRFEVAKDEGGFGPSDHSSFYAKKIPVLHLFTGSHADYHRPTDTAEKINYEGMARIAALVTDAVRELATAAARPAYIEVASKQFARGGGDRPYFGSIPDFGKPGGGYAISGVTKDSPAAKGGLQAGDLIVRVGESAISGLEDFDSALRKHKAGETVAVVVQRGGGEITLQVELGKPK